MKPSPHIVATNDDVRLFQVTSGPKWLDSAEYDVAARDRADKTPVGN